MKISYNWLKNYLNIDLIPEEVSKILTDIGLEVEGLETFEEVKGSMKGMVIGEVLTCGKHPNADKLSVTTVDVGQGEPLSIVCGAPNVASGQKVVVATVGTEMYMGDKSFTINKTKLRGELSEGMICAEDEIGLGTSHDGIMVLPSDTKVGTPAASYFKLKTDTVFEIGLTPNRIDAGSHFGVARDLAAYLSQYEKVELKKPDISAFKPGDGSFAVKVSVEDTEACKRYTGLTLKNIKIAPSPKWLQESLKAIGLNPINNVVDITNFVLHELGQPLHAFDADKLAGNKIVVKKLAENTPFVTLDEVERKLSSEDLMICDAQGGACMAGIFGGMDSGVTDTTQTIFLESAYFDPVSVRKSAKRHGLSTDSSFRFERGVDPNITTFALKRAALLIQEIAGGLITSDITDIYPEKINDFEVAVSYHNIDRLIGKKLDRALIKKILNALDISVEKEREGFLTLKVPAYRVDVTREADVIEEILRIYGYNNVEFSEKIHASLSPSVKPDNELLVNRACDFLASNGFNEIMSNSLTKSSYYSALKTYKEENCVVMLNPLSSDLGLMRQTILFNGLETVAYNINRQAQNLRLFEYGRCYWNTNKNNEHYPLAAYGEDRRIALFLTGNRAEESWSVKEEKASLFLLKAYVEQIIGKLGVNLSTLITGSLESKDDIFTGGIEYLDKKTLIAELGIVKPKLLKQFDIEQEVIFAEIRWDEVLKRSNIALSFREMPKFPEVRRDLALLIDESVKFDTIEQLAIQTEKKLLKKVNLFDFYKGKGIPEGKKSYGVSFYLQDEEKTLTDKEIDRIMGKISQRILTELNAELR
ncbi:MAG: phenylalanine--tRNA ligase subunit beta [Bacteroidales bacterium]|nr:phenylalanine--tRNA ligase subunit beta [Bacteroidales bacterium]MBN2819590.1 phenylalanine--tRNA ligase subunit beta [Bacteroidales bacterium]